MTPSLVFATVIDFSVPDPVRVVPAGSSEQLAEVITKPTGNVSIVAPPCSADNRYDAHSRQADLILTSTFSPILDPEAFLSQLLSHGQLGSALGSGLWTEPQFLARVRRAAAFTGSARRATYRRLEQELLRAAPVAAFGSFYDGHYLSPHVGCRIVQEAANVIDLGMLCKRGRS